MKQIMLIIWFLTDIASQIRFIAVTVENSYKNPIHASHFVQHGCWKLPETKTMEMLISFSWVL